MIDERFIILAVFIGFAGSANYIFNTLKGQTKPNRVTWLLWTLIPMVAFFAMLDKDVGITPLILTFVSAFIPLMTFCATFLDRKAFWKITKFDYICGALSLAGVAAWAVTQEGNLAIVFAIIADSLATLPTLVKSYKNPESESWPNYLCGAIYAFITILTIQEWTFASVAWPINIMVACTVLFVLIKFKIGPRLTSKV